MRTSARAGASKRAFAATAWRSSGRLAARAGSAPARRARSAHATWRSRTPHVIRMRGIIAEHPALSSQEDDGSDPHTPTAPRARAHPRRPAGGGDGLARLSHPARPAPRARGDAGAPRAAVGGRAGLLLVSRTRGRRRHEEPGQRGRDGARVHRAHADDVCEDDRGSARVRARRRSARGGEIAADLGCFACHGPLGAGGVGNPGSFKGYVPGFWGTDFDDLVRSDEELHTWIAKGELPRVAEHWFGRLFFKGADHAIGRLLFPGQAIKMPAYEQFVPVADMDALAAYVRWIRAGSWRPLVR